MCYGFVSRLQSEEVKWRGRDRSFLSCTCRRRRRVFPWDAGFMGALDRPDFPARKGGYCSPGRRLRRAGCLLHSGFRDGVFCYSV
ncbi:MAG: hypothetical protein BWX80_03101 [Candidatus Hydrogenedentes bacterium ADurb.Bin101]|jgi:hypothetical protein|nr:MAG: hypothetical protein BWX80_03101 [Candidatus Hydrogenedentes bacterium ADurb.Bin101]